MRVANDDTRHDAIEFVSQMRDYWGAYHNHKETTGFGAATVYLGAVAAALANTDAVHKLPAGLLLATALGCVS